METQHLLRAGLCEFTDLVLRPVARKTCINVITLDKTLHEARLYCGHVSLPSPTGQQGSCQARLCLDYVPLSSTPNGHRCKTPHPRCDELLDDHFLSSYIRVIVHQDLHHVVVKCPEANTPAEGIQALSSDFGFEITATH